ncbi:MAG TPA: type I restriction endonuclease subunit R, partial [Cyclobacteriaceae bacterium]
PFYTSTTLTKETDVNVLHELKSALSDFGVYEWSEVEDFITKYFEGVDAQQLSPIIDVAANRFNQELELEDDQKADFKIKAKQFVKIYGQMASIMTYEIVDWEKLYWFLKFLIPKLIIKTKEDELIDELLESVDLSTYGLERTKVNQSIGLDSSDSELDPQNPNPRGAHGSDEEKDPLDEIIRTFNDRFYAGWEETPEEARIRTISFFRNVTQHKDFEQKVKNNSDEQNSEIALRKIMDEVLMAKRKANVEEYKKWVTDDAYKIGMIELMKRMIDNPNLSQMK